MMYISLSNDSFIDTPTLCPIEEENNTNKQAREIFLKENKMRLNRNPLEQLCTRNLGYCII